MGLVNHSSATAPYHAFLMMAREEMSEMTKVLRCSDVGLDCTWEGRAETEEKLLQKAAKHAAEVHGETEFSDEEMAAIKAAIREE